MLFFSWTTGNHKPTISGTDEAIWRRPKLIPFPVKIPDEEVDPFFREHRLLPELPGILALGGSRLPRVAKRWAQST